MNVYDFDRTITDKDSSYMFILYALRKYPRAFENSISDIAASAAEYFTSGRKDPSNMKEQLFSVLRYIPEPAELVKCYWNSNLCSIQEWYPEQRRDDDIIISASPDFIVRPMAEKLGVRLIATPMDIFSGNIHGANCKGEEKLRRFRLEFPGEHIDEFYSDSVSDTPMALEADRAFIVKNGKVFNWPAE